MSIKEIIHNYEEACESADERFQNSTEAAKQPCVKSV